MVWVDNGLWHDAGDVGGDSQVGPSTERVFSWADCGADDVGPIHAVISSYWYAEPADGGQYDPDNPPEGYGVANLAMFTLCRDLDDPGGSEIWSDIDYYFDALVFETLERATDHAAYRARLETPDDYGDAALWAAEYLAPRRATT